MSDKLVTFKTYLGRLKTEVNKAFDEFNGLSTDQAYAVCDTAGLSGIVNALNNVEHLREVLIQRERDDVTDDGDRKEELGIELAEVREYLRKLKEEKRVLDDDTDDDAALDGAMQDYLPDATQHISEVKDLYQDEDFLSESEFEECSEMELPNLLTQIRAILNEYPDDGQIIKELVQNADDAKASEIKILYDGRELQASSTKGHRYAKFFKAPALVVFNDAEFTDEDWQGIKRVYNSVKADDPLRVGRFGLGFKSVFHITDYPCIVSGDKMLFMNPLSADSSKVCVTISLSKLESCRHFNIEDCLNALDGVFGFNKHLLQTGRYKGTLFWFPLRNKESTLSGNIYSDSKILDLFRSLHFDSSRNMLFLRYVHRISLYMNIPEDTLAGSTQFFLKQISTEDINIGKDKAFYTAEMREENRDSNEKRKTFEYTIKTVGLDVSESPAYFSCYATICTELYLASGLPERNVSKWFIMNYLHGGQVSDELRLLLRDEALGYLPIAGIALKIDTDDNKESDAGHVFCYQPLPQDKDSQTGLPVHVNAFFALTQNRRHLKWPTADQELHEMHTDSAIKWNKVIVTEILPEAYALFIEELKQKSIEEGNSSYLVEAIYASIPDVTKVTERWQQLATQTTEIIQERNDHILFTLNDGGKWISPMEAMIASFTPYPSLDPKCPAVIKKLLLKDNIDVVCAPEHVTCSMITRDNVVSPAMLKNHLRNRQTYIGMGQQEKLCLLEFIAHTNSIEDLDGIQLTPLDDGKFTSLEKHSSVFASDQDTIKLFPGLEGLFISTELPKTLSDYFHHFAEQGMYAVKLLNGETTAELIRKTLNMHFDESKVINLKRNDYFKWETWLKSIWGHICSTFGHQFDVFKDLPILPVDFKDGEYVNLYALTDTIMVTQQEDGNRLPKHVCDALQLLSVKLISKQPEWIQINLGSYLHDSSSSSVLKIFEVINVTDIEVFNKKLSNEDKMKFSKFLVEKLSSVTETARNNLRKLQIFHKFSSTLSEPAIVSIEENNNLYHGEEYPIKFPCPVIVLTPNESAFAQKLGGNVITREEMVMKTLTTFDMFEPSEQKVFVIWLLNNRIGKTCETVKTYLEKLPYLRAADDKLYSPMDLFDPTNVQLKSLFINEVVFPVDEDFLTKENLLELRKFGLKDETQITAADIEKTCSYIDAHSEEDNPEIRDKATAVLKVLQERNELLRDSHIEELRFIPLSKNRPLSYPRHLKFISEEYKVTTLRPSQVASLQLSHYVGSVLPVVECRDYSDIAKHYNWRQNPKLETVVTHLYNVIASYKDQHKSLMLQIITDLYTFFKNYNATDVKHALEDRFADRRFIWYGDGFVTPERIFVETDSDNIDLKHFLRPLPRELAEHKDFFKFLGCFESVDADSCLKALQQIKHDSENRTNESSDLELKNVSISILNKLKHDHLDDLLDYENRLFVPVETMDGSVQFKLPNECVYCNASWLKDEMDAEDSEEILFVHKDLPISTAEALGVPSLTQKVFADSDAMEEWGQEEPLTRRLRTILEEGYVDGFSIPKELFQNADDAKASKMWMMYDERTNENAKKNLLSASMAQWQGPALWVYNDAEFTEEDFKNITKLSGATKQSNPCSIGKFGLGFCAVYNLTDVPSLISGENIVMFDPHMKYLGKALPGRSPGLKINVRKMKSQTLARKLCNQFRPAENIFGCTLTSQPNFYFKGTLFRFPLRSNQASEISDILYTADKMQKLLDSVYNMAANMFLFNMHVKELKVFHLSNGENPAQPTLLYETSKRSEWLKSDQIPLETGSVLQEVTLRKQRHQLETNQLLIIENVRIWSTGPTKCDSECNWLVSWATGVEEDTLRIANEEEGALPVSAIAVPYSDIEGEICPLSWQDLPDGFYKKGHFFFFLPLPIDHSYPFHINAPLSVSNDRRHIKTMTDDENEERFTNWNETLLRDCVVEALIFLLQSFQHFKLSPRYQQCHLWPLPEESDELFDKVRMYFYKFVVQNVKCRVLLASDKWLNISECTFIDPNLKNGPLCNDITELILNSHAKSTFVDLPCQYYDQLLKSGKELVRAHTIDAKTCVLQFLIPKLDVLHSMFSMNVGDQLIKFAILLHDEEISEKLKKIACIPTQPNGILQFIEKIVDDKSKISNMFDICDGRFSTENFMDETLRHVLTSLGMLHDKLSDEDVLERVGSVSTMNCLHCALERCNNLLLYMEENYEHYAHILPKLQRSNFLPLTCKPNAWFDDNSDETFEYPSCETHADQQQKHVPIHIFDMTKTAGDCTENENLVKLVSPSEVKAYKHKNIISSVSPIICCDNIPKLADYFDWKSDPKQVSVLEHLVNIVQVYKPKLKPVLLPMVINVYQFLSKTDDLTALQGNIEESFAALNNNYIWTGDAFASPKHVYIEAKVDDIDLKPYLKPLPSEMFDLKGFFSQLGCASHVDENALLWVLGQLKAASELDQENTNSTSMRMLAVTVLNKLVNDHSEVVSSPDAKLYIPVGTDDIIEFGLSDKCVYYSPEITVDQEIIDEDEQDILFVHSDVPLALCKALGVPSLTQKLFADSDAMEEWGQEEPLTRRLKSILDEGYVDGFSVPKELCQNADDAGASKMWILYDERENLDARKNLLNADMSEWQGPALWVYNNAEFTEEDFQNINKLNGATKESDPCKIGKFGLGFCSVYNLTDVPSLISGENIIIFDPHMKYLGKALPGKSPGMRINVSKIKFGTFAKKVFNQFKPAKNVFGCNLVSEEKQYFTGTLFRLPLRTKPSDISSTVYSKEEMTKLLDITTECAANLLLFNTNVKEIKLFHIAPNETDPRNAKLLFESCKSVTHLYPPDVFRNTSALKEASQRKTRHELHNNQLQVVDEVNVTRTLYCNQSPTSVSETDWLVSWATGIKSKTITLVYEQEGAVPIGAVALPFEKRNSAYCPVKFNDLPSGFYNKGHFYLFLPLPIDHQQPFHINGQFTVSNNRRSFQTITEEDTNIKFAEWNSCLLGDSIVEAVLLLFNVLSTLKTTDFSVFDIWPFNPVTADSFCNKLVDQFYQKLVEENCPKTLKVSGQWFNIFECKFLEPTLKNHTILGQFASGLFAKNIEHDMAIDIPHIFYEQLLKANEEVVMERTVTTETFIVDLFLPFLDEINDEEKTMRDKMTKFAVNLKSHTVKEQLLEIACIPTRPHGTLKQVTRTVDNKSPLSTLFDENEEYFIAEEFSDEITKLRLSELGMLSATLNDADVLERIQTIRVMIDTCPECALQRCFQILTYFETNIEQHKTILKQLQNESFLPVLTYRTTADAMEEVTVSCCAKHKADRCHFDLVEYGISIFIEDDSICHSGNRSLMPPITVHSSKNARLVGSARPVIECAAFEKVSSLFGWHTSPQLEVVVEHFHNIVKAYTSSIKAKILPMIISVYKYLVDQEDRNVVTHELVQKFEDLQNRFVWFGDGFAAPTRIYVEQRDSDIDLKPFLRPLPPELSEFKDFFKSLGCFEWVDVDVYLDTLKELETECASLEVHNVPTMRRISVNILNELKDHHIDSVHSSSKSVYFPVFTADEMLSMKPADQCVFCDADWLNDNSLLGDEDELMFVHSDISNTTAEALGACSLTDKVFSEAEAMEEWGQEEPLTRRLKNILNEGYVDGFSVPKELFQNADDGGATRMWMLYDKRENEDARQNLLSDGMAQWQGPALWVYNDAEFSEEDFKNIIKLSGGTKESDSCKIGKFGLGFCAVYNLTDVPSFISGDSVVVFDPHMKYLGKAMPGKSPGLRINVSKIKHKSLLNKINAQFRPFEDVFGCRLISSEKAYFKGTLFRFPLRSQESEISNVIYSPSAMEQFLQKTYNSAANMFLFNMNVEELKIFILEKDEVLPSKAKLVYEVQKRHEQIISNPIALKKTSILKDVTQRKTDHLLESNPLRVLQKVNVKRVFHDTCDTSETSWLVSWATGVESATLKLTYEEVGAIPLGAVAVPYEDYGGNIKPIRFDELPKGFYDKGHFFFFLPMPVEHSFPFHANGPFAVSSDRRKLRAMTDDDFEEKYEKWNRCLLGDSLVQAFIYLLQEMQGLHISNTYNFYELWPLCETSLINELPVQFYRKIFQSPELNIFCSFDKWLSISRCVFLDPELRRNEKVGKLAFDVVATFVDGNRAVDLPKCYYEQLKATNEEIMRSKTESIESFILSYFLPNINDLKGSIDEFGRNALTVFSILQRNSNIDSKLQGSECIPTQPEGILRHINETVDKNASFAELFDDTDNCFPIDDFNEPEIHGRLIELGMMSLQLPDFIVLNKAKSISTLSETCIVCANERCSYLLKYLSKAELSIQTIQALQDISFLPVKCKPAAWHAFWMAQDKEEINDSENNCENHSSVSITHTRWEKPVELFYEKWTHLVGCVKKVIDLDICKQKDESLFKKLGVKELFDDREGTDIAITQLVKLATTTDNSSIHIDRDAFINKVVKDIYSYLERACDKDSERIYISKRLQQSKVVWVSGIFTTSDRAALKDTRECPPYLYSVKTGMLSNFHDLCRVLNICEHFVPLRIASALTELSNKYGTMPLTDEDLIACNTLLQMLHSSMKMKRMYRMEELFNNCIQAIYAPDEDKVLRSTSLMCFNDYDAIEKSDTMVYVHASISPEIAKAFGVKSKLLQNLEDISEDIEDFYQEEPLTTRIKGLLDGYPCDASVFKELLQNADDAGATEVHIIFDITTHKTDKVFDESSKLLQGPSLIVFNNKAFTQDDLTGIQKLGIGSKRGDPSKTGRYGVGFNAVYNLTDVPSFLTYGPEVENGETLCFFDPNARYLPNVTRTRPGKRFKNTRSIREHHSDVIDGYHCGEFGSGKEGTIFRLPLRSEKMARHSNIKKDIVTQELVINMLHEFQNELKNLLIFLKNVKTVCVSSYAEKRLTAEYTIEISMSEDDMNERNGFFEYFRKVCEGKKTEKLSILDACQKTANYSLDVSENGSHIVSYKVVQVYGFGGKHIVPEELRYNIECGNLGLLPIGGVALPLTCSKRIQIQQKPCTAFCFLPLPIETGLPADIHGYFALSDEKRRSLWFDSSKSCYKTQWNNLVIKNVITPAYVSLLKTMKAILFEKYVKKAPKLKQLQRDLDVFNAMFPRQEKASDQYWKTLTNSVFVSLVNENECFLPIVKHGLQAEKNKVESICWTSLYFPDCHFPAYADTRTKSPPNTIDETLKSLGLRIVTVSEDIKKSMDTARVTLPELNAIDVIDFLCSTNAEMVDRCKLVLNIPVEESPIKTLENCVSLLRYCKEEKHLYCQFRRMPLLISQKGNLKSVGPDMFMYLTEFTDFFPNEGDSFIHNTLYLAYLFRSHNSGKALKDFTMDDFVLLLNRSDMKKLNEDTISDWKKEYPTDSWIAKFWIFFWHDFYAHRLTTAEVLRRMQEMFNNKVKIVGHVALLPTIEKTHDAYRVDLIKVSEIDSVIDVGSFTSIHLNTAFSKIELKELDTQCFVQCQDICNKLLTIVPNFSCPQKVLVCLLKNLTKIKQTEHTVEESLCILQYFFDHLDFDYLKANMSMLKKLPLFVTQSGERVALISYNTVVVAPMGMPREGLEFLSDYTEIVLLQRSSIFNGREELLSFQTMSVTELYTKYIFPNRHKMETESFYMHVEFIFKLYVDDKISSREATLLFSELSSLAFVEISGVSCKVSSLFSSYVEIFKMFCKETEFLPVTFRDYKYQQFFIRLGLRTKMDVGLFERFAGEVSQIPYIEKEMDTKSKLVAKSLISMPSDFFLMSDLTKVSKIRFLLPETIPRDLQQISSINCSNERICYAHAVKISNLNLCWTASRILPRYAQPKIDDKHSIICSKLKISVYPQVNDFIKHCKNIGGSIAVISPNVGSNNIKIIEQVMQSIYEEFKRLNAANDVVSQHLEMLDDVPIVYFPKEKMIHTAKRVVIECHETEEIPPYLNRSPCHFSLFNDVFLLLGASAKPSIESYVMVLKCIKQRCKDEEMLPDELGRTKVAGENLVLYLSKLPTGQTFDCDELYLPNRDRKMMISESLVLCNNNYIKKRLGEHMSLNYFIGFDKLDIKEDIGFESFIKLVHSRRPEMLKDIIGEEMILTGITFQDNDVSRELERFLHSDTFASGLVRLTKHAFNILEKKWSSDQEKTIVNEMQNVRVRNATGMKTILTAKKENSRQIHGTAEQKTFHIQKDQAVLNIYIDTHSDIWFVDFKKEFAIHINEFLGYCLKDRNLMLLVDIIDAKDHPDVIPDILDKQSIDQYTLSQEIPCSDFPKPGVYVPEKYHQYLDNDCGAIQVFEYRYIAYEIEDPLVDDMLDATPTYVFAEIKRKLAPECSEPLLQKYEVDIGENDFIEVSAFKLYKFIRKDTRRAVVVHDNPQESSGAAGGSNSPPTVKTRNMKDTRREIRITLLEAWKEDEKKRRYIVKRLLFKWHPDKNPDDVDFCTKVCQYIQQCIHKLEGGRNLSDIDSDDEESGSRSSSSEQSGRSGGRSGGSRFHGGYWGTFYDSFERQNRSYNERQREFRRRNNGYSGFSFDYSGVRSEPFSYRREAHRWQRQATSDYGSAAECLKTDPTPAYNWICYKCHQAVEKALKAAWYAKDANHAQSLKHSHDLVDISNDLPANIRALTRQLAEQTGESRRMRYPSDYSIPADSYSRGEASKSCDLAKQILELISTDIG